MQTLREPKRGHRVVSHYPDGSGNYRIEQRGKVNADPTDQRPAVLREAPCERGVDVLVRKVIRRDPPDGRDQPSAEARDDDPGEPDPGGHGGKPHESARSGRNLRVRTRSSDVNCHGFLIGKRLLSLERGIAARATAAAAAALRAAAGGCPQTAPAGAWPLSRQCDFSSTGHGCRRRCLARSRAGRRKTAVLPGG